MIQVEDKIISLDIFEKYFVCDLNACKGACCIEGDAGAPLLIMGRQNHPPHNKPLYMHLNHKQNAFQKHLKKLFYPLLES